MSKSIGAIFVYYSLSLDFEKMHNELAMIVGRCSNPFGKNLDKGHQFEHWHFWDDDEDIKSKDEINEIAKQLKAHPGVTKITIK